MRNRLPLHDSPVLIVCMTVHLHEKEVVMEMHRWRRKKRTSGNYESIWEHMGKFVTPLETSCQTRELLWEGTWLTIFVASGEGSLEKNEKIMKNMSLPEQDVSKQESP